MISSNYMQYPLQDQKVYLPNLPENLGEKYKEFEKRGLKLKFTNHIMEFDPIDSKEFMKLYPPIRSQKEATARLLGDKFRPDVMKANEAKLKQQAQEKE